MNGPRWISSPFAQITWICRLLARLPWAPSPQPCAVLLCLTPDYHETNMRLGFFANFISFRRPRYRQKGIGLAVFRGCWSFLPGFVFQIRSPLQEYGCRTSQFFFDCKIPSTLIFFRKGPLLEVDNASHEYGLSRCSQ